MGLLNWPKPLRHLPRFADLTESEMREVCRAGQVVNIPDGWSPISQSTAPDRAYLLLDGRLSVMTDGREVAQLGPGDLVGEMGLRDNKLRTATIVTLTQSTMLHFTPTAFRELYDRIPAFRAAVDAAIAARTSTA